MHAFCSVFAELLFLPMPPVVDDPDRSWKLKTNAVRTNGLYGCVLLRNRMTSVVFVYTR